MIDDSNRFGPIRVGPIRFGEADLTSCDREPIHIPGSIQPHGVLLAVDRAGLKIRQAAGDTADLLGIEPETVLTLSLPDLFEADGFAVAAAQLRRPSATVPPAILLGIRPPGGGAPLDLTIHAEADRAIVEAEPGRRSAVSTGDALAE